MADDPLTEWNRLNIENAEQKFVSALYAAMVSNSGTVDQYSNWLMAATGASAALLVSQIDSVLPYLSEQGFKACLACLATSGIFGFSAKYSALRCRFQTDSLETVEAKMRAVFDHHAAEEEEIIEHAQKSGITLQTDIDFQRIIKEFSKPFPVWVKWIMAWKVKRIEGNRQIAYHMAAKAFLRQVSMTFMQAIAFLVFVVAAAWWANAA